MPTVAKDGMRGLAVFISDIRNCKSKEAETKRINKVCSNCFSANVIFFWKELANIRSKFKGDKTLDGYHKKKYVCKLLFIFLLGHDVDFGHIEGLSSSLFFLHTKFSRQLVIIKQVHWKANWLFIYLGVVKRWQRSCQSHNSKHQERFEFSEPDPRQLGSALHRQCWHPRNGRGTFL